MYEEDCVNGDWGQRMPLFPFNWYERLPLDIYFKFSTLERGLVPLKWVAALSRELDIYSQLYIPVHVHEDIR